MDGILRYVILTTVAILSLTTAEVHMPDSTVIKDYTEPITETILWPFEEIFRFIAALFNTIIAYICLPFHYLTWFLLASIDAITEGPILLITIVTDVLDYVLRLPFAVAESFIIGLCEGIICLPVNGIMTLASFVIHAPLNFIGIDIRPYLVYYVASITIFIVNTIRTVVTFSFYSVTFILSDLVLQGFIKSLLEFPVWTIFHVIRFPVVLLDVCVEITSGVLTVFIHRLLTMVCSLLRLVCYVIPYAVIFVCYWTLDIFLLLMTILIGLIGWLALIGIVVAAYYSVRVVRKQDTILKIVLKFIDACNRIRNPHIKQALGVISDELPRELWLMYKKWLQKRYQRPGDSVEETLCDVCYESQCFVKLIPCGHSNICKTCIEEIRRRSNTCPMCRASIATYI